ncbi:MAG: hypothetical protein WAK20_10640 [Candidatus Acidiferrum sp.]
MYRKCILSRILPFLFFSAFLVCSLDLVVPAFAQQRAPGDPATATLPKKVSKASGARWLPPDVDSAVPPVEQGFPCDLGLVLHEAGGRIREFVDNAPRFTATESLVHQTVNKTGAVAKTEHRKYDYIVSFQESAGRYNVEEFLGGGSAMDYPGGIVTRGLPALLLIFHPSYSGDFSMTCEGLGNLDGKKVWQVYFRQRSDRPNRVLSYKVGWDAPSHRVDLKGRAWFLADNYQLSRLEADSMHPLPEIQLTSDHVVVEYAPVHFTSAQLDMWLPRCAEVYSDRKGKRIHRRLSFSNYFLFRVDDDQAISTPTIVHEF